MYNNIHNTLEESDSHLSPDIKQTMDTTIKLPYVTFTVFITVFLNVFI